ncbi:hypothetical protein SAY86_019441 [Trapa natans]|uniref:Uncharacterized protein n=1 Tax=Trapa natans TaxID=22666 RepID=A0AAN7LXT9_TRANT|nr:hypothetical protein SAY86_019441 [Trapa natans]
MDGHQPLDLVSSTTFLSIGNPCLDFFFHVVREIPPESLTERLAAAWAHDLLTTLKLICNLCVAVQEPSVQCGVLCRPRLLQGPAGDPLPPPRRPSYQAEALIPRGREVGEEEDRGGGSAAARDNIVTIQPCLHGRDRRWKRMVQDLQKTVQLENCIAVCDVSGSMRGTPMKVCVALGLLVSDLAGGPWKDKIITFSKKLKLHPIRGGSLTEKGRLVEAMDRGTNTDFQRVFNVILSVAKRMKLMARADKMRKRVFVFIDMEFDQASARPEVPQLVFWNLRDSRSTRACVSQEGVALVSRFLKNLLKVFHDNDGQVDPEEEMIAEISGMEYQKLVVVD